MKLNTDTQNWKKRFIAAFLAVGFPLLILPALIIEYRREIVREWVDLFRYAFTGKRK